MLEMGCIETSLARENSMCKCPEVRRSVALRETKELGHECVESWRNNGLRIGSEGPDHTEPFKVWSLFEEPWKIQRKLRVKELGNEMFMYRT